MASEKKKLLVFDWEDYAYPFLPIFDVLLASSKEKLEKYMKEADVVLFTGGEDVSPHLYNEARWHATHSNMERDKFEWVLMEEVKKQKKGILGICRGAQLACVFSGGSLIQDVSGHTTMHQITDMFGNELPMTSTHHQMMRPQAIPAAVMVAWSKTPQSMRYCGQYGAQLYKPFGYIEPEICYFEETKALAIQGHPEMSTDHALHDYCCSLVRWFLFNEREDGNMPKYGHQPLLQLVKS